MTDEMDGKLDKILKNQEIIIESLNNIRKDIKEGSEIDKLQLFMQMMSTADLLTNITK